MSQSEWGRIAAELRKLRDQFRRRSGRQQRREQCIFLSAADIDLVNLIGHGSLAIKIWTELDARYACDGFNRSHTFGWNPVPVRYRRLTYAYFAGEFGYTARH
jgi:hypothetical protein